MASTDKNGGARGRAPFPPWILGPVDGYHFASAGVYFVQNFFNYCMGVLLLHHRLLGELWAKYAPPFGFAPVPAPAASLKLEIDHYSRALIHDSTRKQEQTDAKW